MNQFKAGGSKEWFEGRDNPTANELANERAKYRQFKEEALRI